MRIGPILIEATLTPASRKRKMRENILRNAGHLHNRGLDSRIPFLKFACTLETVRHGSTARKEDGVPVPQWKEGEVIRGSCIDEVIRFNIFNAPIGLQALKSNESDGRALVKIVRCETFWKGDMRISHVKENSGISTGVGAVYEWNLNQIIMAPNCYWSDHAFSHECEHARHTNLMVMSSFSSPVLSKKPPSSEHTMEYLAMLVETIKTPFAPMLTIALRDFRKMWMVKEQIPHVFSSFVFLTNLLARYRVDPRDLWKAAQTLQKHDSSKIDEQIRDKIRKCAKKEYERIYWKIFGLSPEDITEVITNLPMI